MFLNAFETGSEARTGIGRWINYYNADRPYSAFGRQDARRRLCYRLGTGEIGGVIKPRIQLFAPGRSAPESRVCNSEHGSTDRPELARQGSPICGVLEFSPRGARRRHHRLRRDRLHCVPSAKPGLERARSAAQRCRGGNAA